MLQDATFIEIADELARRAWLPCPACHGSPGRICPRCAGSGRVPWPEMRELVVVLRNVAVVGPGGGE